MFRSIFACILVLSFFLPFPAYAGLERDNVGTICNTDICVAVPPEWSGRISAFGDIVIESLDGESSLTVSTLAGTSTHVGEPIFTLAQLHDTKIWVDRAKGGVVDMVGTMGEGTNATTLIIHVTGDGAWLDSAVHELLSLPAAMR